MSGSTNPNPCPDGRRTGPLLVIPGANESSAPVLGTANLSVESLDDDRLRQYNLIQLSYSRQVAEAQLHAYDALLALFSDRDQ